MNIQDFGLGRTVRSEEKALAKYPLRAALPKSESKRKYRYWNINQWRGDQGSTPHCVAYSWLHLLHTGPITIKGARPILTPEMLYSECQKVDEWEGEDYEGTSVNAGAKILLQKGFIKEYRWTRDVEELAQAILEVGPAVIGINWYFGMYFPNKDNHLEIKGRLDGGHAIEVSGVNIDKEEFKLPNSWGPEWGVNGCAKISFERMRRLLNEDGECCLPIEVKK